MPLAGAMSGRDAMPGSRRRVRRRPTPRRARSSSPRRRRAASRVESHVLPGRARRGRRGARDATSRWLGPRRRGARCVLITSGTHGVEGFCGSGCQVALLRDDAFVATRRAGAASRCVLVHAVNPYGFSHLRARRTRTTSTSTATSATSRAPLARNEAYAATCTASSLPRDLAARRRGARGARRLRRERAARARCRRRSPAASATVPMACSSAARAPTWSNTTLREVLRTACRGARRARAGSTSTPALGPCGPRREDLRGPRRRGDRSRARAIFGADVTSFYDGSSTSAEVSRASSVSAALDECPARRVHRDRRSSTARCRSSRCSTRCAPTTGCAAIRTRRPTCARRSSGACATRSTSTTPEWKAMVFGQARVAALQAADGVSRA